MLSVTPMSDTRVRPQRSWKRQVGYIVTAQDVRIGPSIMETRKPDLQSMPRMIKSAPDSPLIQRRGFLLCVCLCSPVEFSY